MFALVCLQLLAQGLTCGMGFGHNTVASVYMRSSFSFFFGWLRDQACITAGWFSSSASCSLVAKVVENGYLSIRLNWIWIARQPQVHTQKKKNERVARTVLGVFNILKGRQSKRQISARYKGKKKKLRLFPGSSGKRR